MSEPTIAQKSPYLVELEAGDYWFCSCGNSQNQPFCDGSHQGTDMTPIKLTIEKKQKAALCGCKHSNNLPFCDGSHQDL